jgi:DnaJ-class molecular chaperone
MASEPARSEPDDPYRVLGLGADASPDEVTRAFRRLARAEHPDVHGGAPEADQQYRRIRGAYDLLRDRARRGDGDRDSGARQGTRQDGRARRIPVKVRSHTPRRGGDLTAELRVGLAEAVYGTTRQLTAATGPAGGQAGAVSSAVSAGKPHGCGSDAGVVRVRIPPGTVTGTRLRLHGHGAPGHNGGHPGDLLVTVEVAGHPRFRQHGRDLHTTMTVGYPELVLGASLPVKTLAGQAVTVHVPAGTTPGTRLRVTGHGIPATGHSPAGDLIVETRLHIPAEPPAPARAALAALTEALPPPRENLQELSPSAGGAAQ